MGQPEMAVHYIMFSHYLAISGTEYIWRLVVEGQEELADFSIALLKDIYSNVTMSHQSTRHKDFIK